MLRRGVAPCSRLLVSSLSHSQQAVADVLRSAAGKLQVVQGQAWTCQGAAAQKLEVHSPASWISVRAASRAAGGKAQDKQASAGGKDAGEIDRELAKAAKAGQGRKAITSLLGVVEAHGHSFTEKHVADAFQKVSELAGSLLDDSLSADVHQQKGFQTLVDMVILGARRFSSRQLADVVRAAGQLKFDEDLLLDKLSGQLLKRLEDISAPELVDLAAGLAQAGHSPSVVLFDALQQRAVALADQISPEQKKALEAAYKEFGYGHKDISEKL